MLSTHGHRSVVAWAALIVAVVALFSAMGGVGYTAGIVKRAVTADKLDGFHASKKPKPKTLLPLNAKGQLPASVVPAGTAGAPGPKGDTGPAGPAGAKGETGAKGDTGPAGAKGETGAKGDVGPAGPQGEKGDTGARGGTGDTGPQGPKGDTGATGPSDAYAAQNASMSVTSTTAATPTVIATLTLPAGKYVVTATGMANNATTADSWCPVGLAVGTTTRWISPSAGTNAGYMDHMPFSIESTATLTASTQVKLVGYKSRTTDDWSVDQSSLVAIKVGDLH